MAELVSGGVKPIRSVYNDGGSHESFVTALADVAGGEGSLVVDSRMRDKFGNVSRPEGLSSGPVEIAMDGTDTGRVPPTTALAYAAARPVPAAVPAPAPSPEVKVAVQLLSGPCAAPAAPARPAASTVSGSTDTPFYKSVLSGITDFLGRSNDTAAETETETAQASSGFSPVPLPPQRGLATKAAQPSSMQKRAQAAPVEIAVAN